MSETTDDKVIDGIVTAFTGYAMDDIKFNQNRPIAAGILISCLLDQVSNLMSDASDARARAYKFVKTYLPKYKEMELYEVLRNPIVHNYAIKEGYSLTSDPAFEVSGLSVTMEGIIYIPSLIRDLEKGMQQAMADLRTNPEIRKRVLSHRNNKVLGSSTLTAFSEEGIRKLWAFYQPLIKTHRLFSQAAFKIELKFTPAGEGTFLVNVLVEELNGNKSISFFSLDNFARLVGLTPPAEYLEPSETEEASLG